MADLFNINSLIKYIKRLTKLRVISVELQSSLIQRDHTYICMCTGMTRSIQLNYHFYFNLTGTDGILRTKILLKALLFSKESLVNNGLDSFTHLQV